MLWIYLTWYFLPIINPPYQAQLNAKEIVRRADEKVRGTSNQGEMVMRIVRLTWQREIGLKSWAKGNDQGLILVTSPPATKAPLS